MTRIILCITLLMMSLGCFAQINAEKYKGYRWRPVKVTSYADRIAGAEAKKNLDAFEILVNAEVSERAGNYKMDIFNGIWFYSISHNWSFPEETDFKLPPFEGQTVTPMTRRTADLLIQAYGLYKEDIEANHQTLKAALDSAMKRITGKSLDQ